MRTPLGEYLEPHRRRIFWQRMLLELWTVGLVAAGVIALVRLAQAVSPMGALPVRTVGGLAGLALGVVVVQAGRRAPDDPETARLLDHHGGTREVIATALELERRDPGSEFGRLLHRRAVGELEGLDPAKRPPFHPGSRPGATLGMSLLLAGLPWLPMQRPPEVPEIAAGKVTSADVTKVRNQLEKVARRVEGPRQPVTREHLERLKRMLDGFERQPPTRRDALDKLSRAVSRMERDRSRLTSWGRSSSVARTLKAQPQLGKVGDRMEKGDARGARDAMREALRDPARREEARRELEQLVKALQEKGSDALEAGGDEGPEEEAGGGDELATPGADPVAQEIKKRDQALQELMKQLAEMDPQDVDALEKAGDSAMDQMETMDLTQMDAESLEQLIRSLKECKSGMGGGQGGEKSPGQGGKKVAVPLPGKGDGKGKEGKGEGQGQGGGEEKGGEGKGAGRELSSPYDPSVKDKPFDKGTAPTSTGVSGDGVTVKSRASLSPGGRVWKVKTAPQRPGGPRAIEPAPVLDGTDQSEDRTVESGVIPGEYRKLVREYFDAPEARGEE